MKNTIITTAWKNWKGKLSTYPLTKNKDHILEDLTVISASKDGNNIIFMDKNRSFYELPRDKVLEGYNKQQEKQHKAEMKYHRNHRIDVEYER